MLCLEIYECHGINRNHDDKVTYIYIFGGTMANQTEKKHTEEKSRFNFAVGSVGRNSNNNSSSENMKTSTKTQLTEKKKHWHFHTQCKRNEYQIQISYFVNRTI